MAGSGGCAVAEERRADADVGGAVGDGGLEVVAHAHREAGEAVAGGEVARGARSAGAGRRRRAGSPSGRRPAGRRCRGRRRGRRRGASGSTPAFCGSRPVLTWTKSVGQAPRACTAVASLRARLSRSRLWMASKSSSARASLLVCSGPTRCSSMPGKRGAEGGPACLRPPARGSRRRRAGRRRAPPDPRRAAGPWRRRPG